MVKTAAATAATVFLPPGWLVAVVVDVVVVAVAVIVVAVVAVSMLPL